MDKDMQLVTLEQLRPFLGEPRPGRDVTALMLEFAAKKYAEHHKYGSVKPIHGLTRQIYSSKLVIDPQTLQVKGVRITWEAEEDYDQRVYDYAQECYLTGKKHVHLTNPCVEISRDTGKPISSNTWTWPHEFIPRGDIPKEGESFAFSLGKVQEVFGGD